MRYDEYKRQLAEFFEAEMVLCKIERHISQADAVAVKDIGLVFQNEAHRDAFGIVHAKLLAVRYQREEIVKQQRGIA